MTTPDFVVIGHVVKDLLSEGWRLGGTTTFAAVQAQRLGLRAGIVTRVSSDLDLSFALPDVAIAGRPSATTTCFENVYEKGRRSQRVPAQAGPIGPEDVPADWRDAPIVLLGPVCAEAPPELSSLFSQSLTGVSAQGWLRERDDELRVRRTVWTGEPFWAGCRVLFVSDEDLGEHRDQLDRWTAEVPVVALTKYRDAADIYSEGRWRSIAAYPTDEVDPTGAGDVFATAFLVRYHETDDVATATRFASAAAACSVEGPGIEHVANRMTIEARMQTHPEIYLQ